MQDLGLALLEGIRYNHKWAVLDGRRALYILPTWDKKRTSWNSIAADTKKGGKTLEKYVALIAHDAKKKDMVELACQFKHVLQEFP